jgi:hypothetical protein
MSILSLDLGNENFVIAIPRRGGVDVALNQVQKDFPQQWLHLIMKEDMLEYSLKLNKEQI